MDETLLIVSAITGCVVTVSQLAFGAYKIWSQKSKRTRQRKKEERWRTVFEIRERLESDRSSKSSSAESV